MSLPKTFVEIRKKYPEISKAHDELAEKCYKAGPLDRKTIHLIKLGIGVAMMSEGTVKAHVRLAKENNASDSEIFHAILIALPTLGWPKMVAALKWAEEEIEELKKEK